MRHLLDILEGFGRPRVLLVGDFLLDRYVYGHVERISPEAPVPILRMVRRESRVGGAGNVATAVAALGGDVCCLGVVGADPAADELVALLAGAEADGESLLRLDDRPTPVKARYVGLAQHRHPQQMLRVDEESAAALPEDARQALAAALAARVDDADVVALEDYDKGVFTDAHTPELIAMARKAGKRVVVDPACIGDYRRYRGAHLLTPNRYETSVASGIEIVDEASLVAAAEAVRQAASADAVLVTLDREGAYLHRADGGQRIPHYHPRSVYDVTGAGDEVLAVLAVAVAEGVDLPDAAALANVAGGLEVERFGVVPIRREEMLDELRRMTGLRRSKVVDRHRLATELTRRRAAGETIVFTNGCFDLLHLGHVSYLQQARELGACLVVAINSDDSVRRLKGPDRPIIGEDERAGMLASLECVDYVTVFAEDTPIPLLEMLRPEILVKGGTTPKVVGQELVESYGGRVLTLDAVAGLSTTELIERIVERNGSTDPAET